MNLFLVFRILCLALAILGYFANGAQAHVQISKGETLTLMMCSTGHNQTVQLELPGDAPQETEDTCCGDCAPVAAVAPTPPLRVSARLMHAAPTPTALRVQIHPRSPLWPGAPPHGPPASHNA